MARRPYSVVAAGQTCFVEVEDGESGDVCVTVGGRQRQVRVRKADVSGVMDLFWFEGTHVVRAAAEGRGARMSVAIDGFVLPVEVADARVAALKTLVVKSTAEQGAATVHASIPGRVVKVLVRAGDKVLAGQGILVIEAMKMENQLQAPRDGVVKEIRCVQGAAVEANQALLILE